jgi:hypothetical protein
MSGFALLGSGQTSSMTLLTREVPGPLPDPPPPDPGVPYPAPDPRRA